MAEKPERAQRHCRICPLDDGGSSMQEREQRHAIAQRNFALAFVESDSMTFSCKICERNVISLDAHAEWHRIRPWYVDEGKNEEDNRKRYKMLFDNRVSLVGGSAGFYCFLCENKSKDIGRAVAHLADARHVQAMNREPPLHEIFKPDEDIAFEFLVTQGLQPWGQSSVRCALCDVRNIPLEEVRRHVSKKTHLAAKQRREASTNNDRGGKTGRTPSQSRGRSVSQYRQRPRINDGSFPRPTTNRFVTGGGSPGSTSAPSVNPIESVFESRGEKRYCLVCQVVDTEQHSTDESHAKNLRLLGYDRIYPLERGIYRCGWCNCFVPTLKEIIRHVRGIRHQNNLLGLLPKRSSSAPLNKVSRQNKTEKPNNNTVTSFKMKFPALHQQGPPPTPPPPPPPPPITTIASTSRWTSLPRDYIDFDEKVKRLTCRICNLQIQGHNMVDVHIASKGHDEALKDFHANIRIVGQHLYHCARCSRDMSGLDELYLHVAHHHRIDRSSAAAQNSTDNDNNDVNKDVDNKDERDAIVAISESDSCCKICRTVSSRNKMKRHEMGQDHIERLKLGTTLFNNDDECSYRCESCESNIPNFAAIYLHVIGLKHVSHRPAPDVDIDMDAAAAAAAAAAGGNCNSDERHADQPKDVASEAEKPPSRRRLPRVKNNPVDVVGDAAGDNEKSNTSMVDKIYDTNERDRETEKSYGWCLFRGGNRDLYCLVCRKNVSPDRLEHIWSIEHRSSLENLRKDHEAFADAPGQLSELDLASQYMEETCADSIYCHVCDKDLENEDSLLENHIRSETHDVAKRSMYDKVVEYFSSGGGGDEIEKTSAWYTIVEFTCAPCSLNYYSESSFVKHLSAVHSSSSSSSSSRPLMYDYCSACGLLWYGDETTRGKHSRLPSHKYQRHLGNASAVVRDSLGLPTLVEHLISVAEDYVRDTIAYLEESSSLRMNQRVLILDHIRDTVGNLTPDGSAFIMSPTGMESPETRLDINLDCRAERAKIIERFMEMGNLWLTEQLSSESTTVMRVRNRSTGILCEIHLDNDESAMQSSKIIEHMNNRSPECRRLILFIKHWLCQSNLLGPDKITVGAVYWLVIFYLQSLSLVPSIEEFIERPESAVAVAHSTNNLSNVQHLIAGFFDFYAQFNYRYDVACPFIGKTLEKRAFLDPKKGLLPPEIVACTSYVARDDENPLAYPPMCLQDPCNFAINITGDVPKRVLVQFREYAFQSHKFLQKHLSQ